MTGRAELDPLLCVKYARFASHLDRWHFKVIYFTLFIANLFLLFLGSFFYTKYVHLREKKILSISATWSDSLRASLSSASRRSEMVGSTANGQRIHTEAKM